MAAKISRRNMLRLAAIAAGGALVGCAPKVVEVTRVVEKEVEKVVKETVVQEKVVKETVVQEKVVKETVVVDKNAKKAEVKADLKWDNWRGQGTGWNQERISSFKEIYPNVNVEFRPIPWGDYAKMYTLHASGDLGDIHAWDPGHLVFHQAIENGVIIPLDDYMAADADLDLTQWFTTFIDMQKYKGKTYGLPSWGWSGHDCFISNVVHFKELGIEPPDPMSRETSMDTLAEWIHKFFKPGKGPGEVERFGLVMMIGDASLGSICRAFGGEFLSDDGTKSLLLDDANTQKGLKWAYDLIVKDKVVSTGAELPAGHYSSFAEGKVSMGMGGALDIVRAYTPAIKDKEKADPIGVFLPRRPDGKIPSWVFGGTWNVYSKSKYPEAAYAFIRHITTKEGCQGFNLVAGEGAMVRPDVMEILKVRHVAYKWAELNLKEGMLFWPPVANVRGKEMRDTFVQYLQKLMDKNQPIAFEQGLQELHNATQKVLDMEPA